MNPSTNPPSNDPEDQQPTDANRRGPADRRQRPTSAWDAFSLSGRRTAQRREHEHRLPYFVDRFSCPMFICVLMLLTATVADAVLTIQLLGEGAKEINPLMEHLLQHGVMPFLIVKYLLTVTGLPLLLIFKNHYMFRSPIRVGHLIPMCVGLYAILISYQLILMQKYGCL